MDIEKEIDKMYEELDQKQAEMEELGLINYGDTGYYWRNPEEYEKDKRICELESEIEFLKLQTSKYLEKGMIIVRTTDLEAIDEKYKKLLAEKEKEIERLKQLVKAIDIYNQYSNDAKNLILLNPDNCYTNGHQVVIKTNDQDKISFCIEQLEKVKEYCDGIRLSIKYIENSDTKPIQAIIDEINQLITDIKEGK